MLEDLIVNKLKALHVEYEVVPNSDWVRCQCINPEHVDSHPSAGVNKDSGIFHCFSCGHTAKFITEDDDKDAERLLWESKYSKLSVSADEEKVELKEVVLPPVAYKVKEAWRGVSAELLEELGVYYCNTGRYKGRYIFPMYLDGVPISFDARIVDDTANVKEAKWLRPKGVDIQNVTYPYDKLAEMGGDHIVVTEGVMDAVSYIQMGIPAIPSFSVAGPKQRRIEDLIRLGYEYVTIAFDNDDAGVEGTVRVLPDYAKWFQVKSHPMVDLIRASGEKDANDFLVKNLSRLCDK